MSLDHIVTVPVALLPVLGFLAVLLYLDSYKLVTLRTVLWLILTGGLAAVASYYANGLLLAWTDIDVTPFSRYVAPLVEEFLKGLVVVFLVRSNRIGFLVDAAIFGFAVGTGFAVIENIYYLQARPDAHLGVWIVRGFGTAIMHGGATALLAIVSQPLAERHMSINPVHFLPGLTVAVVLHSIFNHFFLSPILQTIGIMLALPPLMYFVYQRSVRSVKGWLHMDFDADAELLELIHSGKFSESKAGRYLNEIKDKFRGPVVADLLCYLRLYTELALRAKGVLLMRDNGFEVPVGERTRAKFQEMRYLERSIGKTGRLAMQPFLHIDRKDLWQLYVLEQ